MTVQEILTGVENDLSHGDLESARRRLRDTLVTRPHRLDVRLQLAAVYRVMGDLPQAGRWGYLSPQTPADEIFAFRAACSQDAATMLEALAWGEDDHNGDGDEESRRDDESQITPYAWEQLADLRRRATAAPTGAAGGVGAPPAVPYPFTPPTGVGVMQVPDVAAPVAKKPRLREQVGLGIVILGILAVLAILGAIGWVVVSTVYDLVRNAYS